MTRAHTEPHRSGHARIPWLHAIKRTSEHTAESYAAKYLKQGQPNLNRLRRYQRLRARERRAS